MSIAEAVIQQTRHDLTVMRRRVELLRKGQSPGVSTANGAPATREDIENELVKSEQQISITEENLKRMEAEKPI